ncbi:hypothetical protein E1B28_010103 [Marasmius oreades]|uniref:Uncharacterized protein n=1 Tax=Marasmius oreades TaxID=181124 RepID=A0A9P7RX27_9AGAR|nr:uncharacterized protein E1B28_010103 [Marasmius oreades]KAG7091043.1 hypothetical protein E1B28_010103 [Marasmius oreades]
MNNHKQELERFCADQGCSEETFQKALNYLQSAHAKRAGQRTTGNSLVPGCAYLASQRLQNNEISKDAARRKSCLTPAIFEKECENIRKLLPVDNASSRQGRRMRGYEQLIQRYRPSVSRATFHHWLHEVENKLSSSRSFDWESVVAKCAIFFWVYEVVEDKSLNKHEFADENQVDRGNLTAICSYLDRQCKNLRGSILEGTRSPSPTPIPSPLVVVTPRTSPRKSPLKRPLRAVLSRPSPKKLRKSEPEPEPESETPVPSNDVEMLPPLPKTPSKRTSLFGEHITPSSSRQMLDIPAHTTRNASPTRQPRRALGSQSILPPSTPAELFTPSRRKSARIEAAVSHSPLRAAKTPRKIRREDLMRVDVDGTSSEDEEAEIDLPLSRRFRPVFRDRKLWCGGDPQLRTDWEKIKKLSQRRVELYGPSVEQVTGGQ